MRDDAGHVLINRTPGSKRSERRLCRCDFFWGEVRKGGEAPLRAHLTLRSLEAKRWRG